jgi:hypothetical protein
MAKIHGNFQVLQERKILGQKFAVLAHSGKWDWLKKSIKVSGNRHESKCSKFE